MFKTALLSMLAVAVVTVGVSPAADAGVTLNGVTLNGVTLNGITLNGDALHGAELNGLQAVALTLADGSRVDLR